MDLKRTLNKQLHVTYYPLPLIQDIFEFCTNRAIVLCYSPDYHPESNGFAERTVQILKRALDKLFLDAKQALSSPSDLLSDYDCDTVSNVILFLCESCQ